MEILHWLSVITMARQGNSEMENYLRQENELRRQQNRPTVEEELKKIAEEMKPRM